MKKYACLLVTFLLIGCGGDSVEGDATNGSTPVVSTVTASSITPTSAILNGTVIPNGLQTQSWFEYGTDFALATYTSSPKQDAGSGLSSQAASMIWNGLAAGTTYYFRFCAENSKGSSKGLILSFATSSPGSPPTVATLSATVVGATTAILNGNVTPNGLVTTAWFEYGADPTLVSSTSTSTQSAGSGTTSQSVTAAITGLSTGTKYYYRVAASNSSGTTRGSIASFTPGAAPAVNTLATTSVGTTTAILNGNVTPNGLVTTAWFEYGADPTLVSSTSTSTQSVGSGTTSQSVTAAITGLSTGTKYYYRVAASNSSGTTKGSIEGFTPTSPPLPAPTGVTATAGAGEATISWSAVADATSYNIYYSQTSGVKKATGIKLANRISPNIVTGLTSGTTYYFIVTAVNAGGESVESSQVSATPFVEYVAFGSSTTLGVGDDYPFDDTSLDGRNNGGGYEPILNDNLTSATGIPHSIVNEGYGGYTTTDALIVLPTVLANHPNATYYLIQFGSNDAGENLPSGLGLNPGDSGYNGSYKDNMQRMISAIKTAGKIPYLAKLGYTLVDTRNVNILVYNQVIDELVVLNIISVTPPDFYGWFQAHQDQLADIYHPNGIGYRSMANLWLKSITESLVPR